MAFHKLNRFTSASSLSLIAVVVLVFGLFIAVSGSRQRQENRSHAAEITSDETVDVPTLVCTSTGQLCSPAFTHSVQTQGILRINYTVGPLECASSRYHFLVDGVEKKVSDWLGW